MAFEAVNKEMPERQEACEALSKLKRSWQAHVAFCELIGSPYDKKSRCREHLENLSLVTTHLEYMGCRHTGARAPKSS